MKKLTLITVAFLLASCGSKSPTGAGEKETWANIELEPKNEDTSNPYNLFYIGFKDNGYPVKVDIFIKIRCAMYKNDLSTGYHVMLFTHSVDNIEYHQLKNTQKCWLGITRPVNFHDSIPYDSLMINDKGNKQLNIGIALYNYTMVDYKITVEQRQQK